MSPGNEYMTPSISRNVPAVLLGILVVADRDVARGRQHADLVGSGSTSRPSSVNTFVVGLSTNTAVSAAAPCVVTCVAIAPSLEFMMSSSATLASRSSRPCLTSADHIAPDEFDAPPLLRS